MAARFHLLALFVAGIALSEAPVRAASQVAPLRYDIWSPEYSQLPRSGPIASITQTTSGYLWLGTGQGVIRFDGRNNQIYDPNNTPELRDYSIDQLLRDPVEGLWILTERGSLAFYRSGKVRRVGRAEGMPEQGVAAIATDRAGRLWAVTVTKKLYRYKPGETWEPVDIEGLAANVRIRRIFSDSLDRRWLVAIKDGFATLYLLAGNLAAPIGESIPDSSKFEPSKTRGLLFVSGQKLWRYEVGKRELLTDELPFTDSGSEVTAILESDNGLVWIGSRAQGLMIYSPTQDRVYRPVDLGFEFDNRQIAAIYMDREDHIWIADGSGTVHRVRERILDVFRPGGTGEAYQVRTICEARDGAMWFGTDGGGLYRLQDGGSVRFGIESGLFGEKIQSVCEDADGTLWAAVSKEGIFRESNGEFTRVNIGGSRDVRALFLDADNVLWAGTYDQGLFRREGDKFVPVKIAREDGAFEEQSVTCLARDRDGALWVGTHGGGLKRVDKDGIRHFYRQDGDAESLPINYIFALHTDEEGNLWVGTSKGLSRFDGDRFRSVPLADGLGNTPVYQIFEDGHGRLWLVTDRGILRIEKPVLEGFFEGTLDSVRCAVFDETDGMKDIPSNTGSQPMGLQSRDGRLWIPTGGWVAILDPLNMKQNDRTPIVVIEEFSADDVPHDVSEPIVVLPGADEFTIGFTGISFADPHRVTYSYRLEGYDSDWIVRRGAPRVIYRDLPPGEFTFHLRAANKDGVWTPRGKSISFKILPPFWRTKVFLFLMICAAFLCVRYISLKKIRARLKYVLRQRALESERVRIAKDMHDDLGANLTQISLMGELLRRNPGDPAEVEKTAGRIAERSRLVSIKLDEIVWAVNPKNDTVDKLASYLVHFAEEFLEPAEIACRLDVPARLPDWAIDSEMRHNVFMTVKESMNNAVKHSAATEIWLRISCDESRLRISVEDNGKGFDPDSSVDEGSDGLGNMRQRVEENGGEFEICSQPGKGTKIASVFKLN